MGILVHASEEEGRIARSAEGSIREEKKRRIARFESQKTPLEFHAVRIWRGHGPSLRPIHGLRE
jgi:hypothetical protein